MPQAVTHILIPLILLNIFRDFFVKNKKTFPLHYVLIGGIAGVLPDFDIALYYILGFFGFTLNEIHRTFSHNIIIPLLFLVFGFLAYGFKNKKLGVHHIKLRNLFFIISFGIFTHLIFDFLVSGLILPLYPFSNFAFGLNLINIFPEFIRNSILPSFDAFLLIIWLIYLEFKHKISDFI